MLQKMEGLGYGIEPILRALPQNLRKLLLSIPIGILKDLEEIRIRQGRPLMIYSNGRDYFLCNNGTVNQHPRSAYLVSDTDSRAILELISDYSVYAFEEELSCGFITLQGGYRVGLSGKVIIDSRGTIKFQHITSFNLRISREIKGVANKIIPYTVKSNHVLHTLILSAPQMGKTTLIRDFAKKISNGFPGFKGLKVGIVDERSEIAGSCHGIPQNDVGIRTDVLDGCPKAAGITMLIRSMSPNVIVTDEVGKPDDVEAIEDALNAGITVITTAHSSGLEDAKRRPILESILQKGIFQRILVLGNSLGTGTLEKVYDGINGEELLSRPMR